MFRSAYFFAPLLALTGALASTAMANDMFPADQIPIYNVPKMKEAPTIDGTINADEWRDSVRLMGVSNAHSNTLVDRPISFNVAWNEKHLFIAARGHVVPNHVLLKAHREPYTTGVVFDDAFEFGISMLGRNRLKGEADSYFKFIVNYLASGEYMKSYPSIGQALYNWTPKMKIKSALHDTPEGRFWEMEISADLEDLQMPVDQKVGDQIKLLTAYDAKNPTWIWAHIPSNTGYLVENGFPVATLTDKQPYVQIEKLTGMDDEKLDMRSVIRNPSDAPAKVHVVLQIRNEGTIEKKDEKKVALNEDRIIDVPAHGEARFDINQAFPGFDYRYEPAKSTMMQGVFDFKVTPADAPAGSRAIFQHYLTFRKDESKPLWKPSANQPPFFTEVRFNPIKSNLWLVADTQDAQLPAGSSAGGMSYVVKQGDKVVGQGQSSQIVYYKYQKLVQLPSLAPGKYQVDISLTGSDGKPLLTKTEEIEKKDEAKIYAQWWGNKIGNTEQILRGFEPLKVKGNRVSCVRREYQFDSLGLPSQIMANGGNVLSSPVKLKLLVAGKEYSVPVSTSLKFTDRKDWQVDFVGTPSVAAGVRFTTSGRMEQDGNVTVSLKYAPTKTPVTIEKLWIEWPVDDSFQNSIACIGVGGNYAARTIGHVPAGQGEVWNTLKDIGNAGSGETIGNFYQDVWVGTEKRGLFWWSPSDEGWVPNDDTPAHSVERRGQTTVLCNNLINTARGGAPFELNAERTVKFSYNASPFKNLASGWRIKQKSAANGFSGGKYKVNWDTGADYFSILSPPFEDQKRWPEYYAFCKAEAQKIERSRGIYDPDSRLGIYLTNQIALRGYAHKTVEPGLYEYFGPEWETYDDGETLNPTYCDYMTWLMDKQVKEGGARHFYFDISFTGRVSKNLSSGRGYLLPDGRIQPSGGDDTLREWYRRTSAMIQDNGFYPGGVSGHATNTIPLAALPFADAIIDSEFPMKDPIAVYPSERMKALSVPEAFGVVISHLGFMNPDWAAFHDANSGGNHGSVFMRAAWRNWGIAKDDVQFIPYWRNSDVVKSIDNGLIASLWKRPHTAIVGIMNYGPDKEGEEPVRAANLKLDLKALGVPAGAKVRIAELSPGEQYEGLGRYLPFKWYEATPGKPSPWNAKEIWRYRPVANLNFDQATGSLSGFNINYHDQYYIVLNWEDKPETVPAEFTGPLHDIYLNWSDGQGKPYAGVPAQMESGKADVKAWVRPDSVLLQISSKDQNVANFQLDLKGLGVKVEPSEIWKKYNQIYSLDGLGVATFVWPEVKDQPQSWSTGTAYFDATLDKMVVRLLPNQTRTLCINRD